MYGSRVCLFGRSKGCTKSTVNRFLTCRFTYDHSSQSDPGPVVRIKPSELHVNDPEYYDEIYASGNRRRDVYGFS